MLLPKCLNGFKFSVFNVFGNNVFFRYFFVIPPPAPPYADETLESLFPRGCETDRALLSILDIRGESKKLIIKKSKT